jgi:hypothetical protein
MYSQSIVSARCLPIVAPLDCTPLEALQRCAEFTYSRASDWDRCHLLATDPGAKRRRVAFFLLQIASSLLVVPPPTHMACQTISEARRRQRLAAPRARSCIYVCSSPCRGPPVATTRARGEGIGGVLGGLRRCRRPRLGWRGPGVRDEACLAEARACCRQRWAGTCCACCWLDQLIAPFPAATPLLSDLPSRATALPSLAHSRLAVDPGSVWV